MTLRKEDPTALEAAIAERERFREALSQSLANAVARVSGVLDAPIGLVRGGDSILVQDFEGVLLGVNLRAEQLLAVPRSEILGRRFVDFVAAEEHVRVATFVKNMSPGGFFSAQPFHFRLTNGSQVAVDLSCCPLDFGNNQALVWFARPHRDAPGDSGRPDTAGHLTRVIAHDLGNLLGVINAYCEVLAQSVQGESELKNLSAIHRAAVRARDLTRRLFDLRPESAVLPTALDLNEPIAALGSMFDGVIGGKIVLVSKLDPAGCPIGLGGEQVDQVLVNLVMNARDAMPDGGILTLETSIAELGDRLDGQQVAPGKYVVLRVTDTGVGTDAEASRLALGLETVQWIVAQNGGYVSITSSAGEGTTLSVYLPRA